MMRFVVLVVAPGLLSGCWDSYRQSEVGDGAALDGRDAPVLDGRDDATEEAEPARWHFVDVDVPDRAVSAELLSASSPHLAWNGSVAGLLYRGPGPGDDHRISFHPMDARGMPAGEDSILLELSEHAWPAGQLAAETGGTFLVSVLVREWSQRIELLRVSSGGTILAHGVTGLAGEMSAPVGPPAVSGEYVIIVTRTTDGTSPVVLYRFRRSDLSLYGQDVLGPTDGTVRDPTVVNAPGEDGLLVFYRHAGVRLRAEACSAGVPLACSDAVSLDLPENSGIFFAAATGTDWFAFARWWSETGFDFRLRSYSSHFEPYDDSFGAPSGDFFDEGSLVAAASDRPAWAAVLSPWRVDHREVLAALGAEPIAGVTVHDVLEINDTEVTEGPESDGNVAVAWTDAGFLVVWDRWRESLGATALFSSFVALVRD
ncbi:MAG: hypothetical protein HY905_05825 [Deltaproteobacteria bacterium]|nr:hypothetical protein [Deltaproteobacteria bacterium]